jgi:Ca2+-binding RTX toxin-like protein
MRRFLFLVLTLLALAAPSLTAPTASAQDAAPSADGTDVTASGEPTCFGKVATNPDHVGIIKGTPGNDVLIGDNRANRIQGNGGVDRICGLSGDDTISASGDVGFSRRVFVRGDDGNDAIFGSNGDDQFFGGDGDDTIAGDSGDDEIFGGRGNDTLIGNDGFDFIVGGPGTDECAEENDLEPF